MILSKKHHAARIAYASVVVAAMFEPVYADETTNTGAAYAAECSAKGVPLPPDWGGTNWTFSGPMGPGTNPPIENFIVTMRPALVYYANSAQGLCMTLPRPNLPNATPGANTVPRAGFGVICQGTNGNVCFWDNATPVPWHDSNGATVLSPSVTIASTNPANLNGTFVGGASLLTHPGGVCTDCHAGKNPFIVMPSRPTKLPPAISQTVATRYNPIVPAKWLQGTQPGTTLDGVLPAPGCLGCHVDTTGQAGALPTLSPQVNTGFCLAVLKRARDLKEMPPSTANMERHWDTVSTVCKELATFTSPVQAVFASGTSAQPRETFSVTANFRNVGSLVAGMGVPWSGVHTLGVSQPSTSQTWNAFSVSVGTTTAPVAQGDNTSATIQVMAPLATGTYPLKLGIFAPSPTGPVRIGESDTIMVSVASNFNATITFVTVPNSLASGSASTVTVAVRNNGPGDWTAGPGFSLQPRQSGRLALPVNSINLPSAVPAGTTVNISFDVKCNSPGLGGLTVQMGGPGGTFPASIGRNIVCQ